MTEDKNRNYHSKCPSNFVLHPMHGAGSKPRNRDYFAREREQQQTEAWKRGHQQTNNIHGKTDERRSGIAAGREWRAALPYPSPSATFSRRECTCAICFVSVVSACRVCVFCKIKAAFALVFCSIYFLPRLHILKDKEALKRKTFRGMAVPV